MSSDDKQATGKNSQENYEAAVLDFLDKEMASVQPAEKKNSQSEELDTLVSNLMQQVITEAEGAENKEKTASEDMSDVLSEFPPKEAEALPPSTQKEEKAGKSPAAPVEAKSSSITKPAEAKSSFSTP